MNRRSVLGQLVGGIAVTLSGCLGDDGDPADASTPSATPPPGPTPTEMATRTPDEMRTETATERPTETATEAATDVPADTSTGTPTETRTEPPTETKTNTPAETATETPTETSTPTGTPAPDQTVVVGPNGLFQFNPPDFDISAGDTVRWEWDSGGHNVRPSMSPDNSTWSGTPGEDGTTYDDGYVYTYTFDVAGEYEYYCAPHRQAGMQGSFTVN